MGTPDDKLFIDPKDRDDLPEIIDDLDPVGNCVETKFRAPHAIDVMLSP